MKARHLIDASSYAPEDLKLIGEAFDNAWSALEGSFSDQAEVRKQARVKLAKAVLSVAAEGERGVETLTSRSLELMSEAYRTPELGSRS